MAIVHHSNHVKYFEEARVALLQHHQVYGPKSRLAGYQFAVIRQDASYFRPLRFGDEMQIHLECRLETAARLIFRYAIYVEGESRCVSTGSTMLVPLDEAFKPKRLPTFVEEVLNNVGWSENWPPKSV